MQPAPTSSPATPLTWRALGWVLLVLWLLGWTGAHAQAPDAMGVQAPTISSKVQIEAISNEIASTQLTEAQQTQVKDELKAASAALASAATTSAQANTLRQQADAAGSAVAPPPPTIPGESAARFARWQTQMARETSIPALERLLADERNASTQLRQRIDQAAGNLADLLAQPARLSDSLVALGQRSDRLASSPPATNTSEPPLLQRAKAVRRAAEKTQVDAEISLRHAEQDTAGERQNTLEAQLQTLQRDLATREPRAAWLNRRIAQLSRERLRDQAAHAQAEADRLSKQDPPALGELARSNAKLAEQLADDTERLAEDRQQLTQDEQQQEQISSVLRDAQARLRLGGNSAAIGNWLWQQRLAMPSLRTLQRQRRDLLEQLSDLRLRQYALADLRRAALNPAGRSGLDGADAAASAATGAGAPANDPTVEAELDQLRDQQNNLSDQITPLLAQRVAALEQGDRLLASIIDRGTNLRGLMDRELLWVPSHPPIDLTWLRTLPQQLVIGMQAMRPAVIGQLVRQDMGRHPLLYLSCALFIAALWWLRRYAAARLDVLAARTRDVLHDRFANTLQALFWSGVVALPWPVACSTVGLLLMRLGDSHTTDAEALGSTLLFIGLMGLALALLHALIRPNGLAEAHLRWGQQRLADMRRAWMAVTWLLLPTAFVALWPLRQGIDAAIGAHARLAVMAIGVCMGCLTIWMLRRERLWPNMPQTLHRVLMVAVPAAYFLTTLMAAAGYVYSAITVIDALLSSALVLLVAQTVYGMLDRWLLLGERTLALKARQRDQQRSSDVVDQESRAANRDDDDAAAIELVSVSAQGRRLLKVVRLVILLVGLILAWGDVAPALLRFDTIALWHFSDKGPDGKAMTGVVTASDLMIAALLVALSFSLVRNIPGLVELALSASHRIAASTRYTVTMLLRYSVVLLGTLGALGLLGVRWSQLQWMAAALTVGLGFGLQEIFANFVSGLILLVERPFRVGDTITIGNVSGTVTRIRTRATVVQDFDNKENIIPNKTFITGQVVNWTLSDDVTRVSVPVGVAYGSPVPRVHELLVQVATEHPDVLKEPPPRSWFLALGNSTLDFELRVYVAGLGNRLPVQNAILGRIAELFAAEGIEIAFPQMDVHVRDWPPVTTPRGGTPGPDANGKDASTGQTPAVQ